LLIISAETDPPRRGGGGGARKLKEAGVAAIAPRYNGMIRDFVLLNGTERLVACRRVLVA
jgi:acetyl esterase/lipase